MEGQGRPGGGEGGRGRALALNRQPRRLLVAERGTSLLVVELRLQPRRPLDGVGHLILLHRPLHLPTGRSAPGPPPLPGSAPAPSSCCSAAAEPPPTTCVPPPSPRCQLRVERGPCFLHGRVLTLSEAQGSWGHGSVHNYGGVRL